MDNSCQVLHTYKTMLALTSKRQIIDIEALNQKESRNNHYCPKLH
jgi:hypothetical protein